MNTLQLGGGFTAPKKRGLRDLSIRVKDPSGKKVATWFAPGWRVRQAEERDEPAYFVETPKLAARLSAWAAALRWPAAALCALLAAAHLLDLWSAAELYSAEALVGVRRPTSVAPVPKLSAIEAGAARALLSEPEVIRDAAARVRPTAAPLEAAVDDLEACLELRAAAGEPAIGIVCRAATPRKAAAGANAVAAALIARQEAKQRDLDANQAAAAETNLFSARPDPFHFDLLEAARPETAARGVPWGRVAALLILAALSLSGFAAARRRRLGSAGEVREVFGVPVLVVERGGPDHVS